MLPESIFIGLFITVVVAIFVLSVLATRFLSNKIYRKEDNPGEFETLVALKSAQRMKSYYVGVLMLVALVLIYLPEQISAEHLGRLVMFAAVSSEIVDRCFRRQITASF